MNATSERSESATLVAIAVLSVPFLISAAMPEAVAAVDPWAFLLVGCLAKLGFQAWGAWLAHRCAQGFEAGTSVRHAWRLLSLGLLGMLLGQLWLARYQILLKTMAPFPSPGDIFFLLAYPMLFAALAAFWKAYQEAGFPLGSAGEHWALLGGTAALGVVIGQLLLGPIVSSAAPGLEKAVNIAYPVLDLILLLPTALLLRAALRFRGGHVGRIWGALLAGVIALVFGDVGFGYLSTLGWARLEPLVDVAYIVAYGSLALGSLAQRDVLTPHQA